MIRATSSWSIVAGTLRTFGRMISRSRALGPARGSGRASTARRPGAGGGRRRRRRTSARALRSAVAAARSPPRRSGTRRGAVTSRGHDPAGRVGRVLLQRADLRRRPRRPSRRRSLVQRRRGRARGCRRGRPGPSPRATIDASAASMSRHDRRRQRRVHLRQDCAGGVGVEVLGDVRRLLGRQVLQHVGPVGGGDLLDPRRRRPASRRPRPARPPRPRVPRESSPDPIRRRCRARVPAPPSTGPSARRGGARSARSARRSRSVRLDGSSLMRFESLDAS